MLVGKALDNGLYELFTQVVVWGGCVVDVIIDEVERVKVVCEDVRMCLVVFHEMEATNMSVSLTLRMFILISTEIDISYS